MLIVFESKYGGEKITAEKSAIDHMTDKENQIQSLYSTD